MCPNPWRFPNLIVSLQSSHHHEWPFLPRLSWLAGGSVLAAAAVMLMAAAHQQLPAATRVLRAVNVRSFVYYWTFLLLHSVLRNISKYSRSAYKKGKSNHHARTVFSGQLDIITLPDVILSQLKMWHININAWHYWETWIQVLISTVCHWHGHVCYIFGTWWTRNSFRKQVRVSERFYKLYLGCMSNKNLLKGIVLQWIRVSVAYLSAMWTGRMHSHNCCWRCWTGSFLLLSPSSSSAVGL